MAWAVCLVLQGVLPGAIVYLTKPLVDSVEAAVGQGVGWATLEPVLWYGGLFGTVLLAQQGIGSLYGWVNTAQSELVRDYLKGLIHERAIAVDYKFYESPEYYDLLEQANSQAGGRSLSLLQNVGGLLQGSITFLTIAAILTRYSLLLPFVLVLSTLPALYVVIRYNRKYHA